MKSIFTFSPPVIIIGMHRSGTSLLSRVLNDSGIYMGAIRDHNGESWPFLSANQLLLQKSDAHWTKPKVISSSDDLKMTPAQYITEHYKLPTEASWRRALIVKKRWGWKDPRNTFTLPFWLKLFPKAKVIHIIRDPHAVSNSLLVRNHRESEQLYNQVNTKEAAFALWTHYVEQGKSYAKTLGANYIEIQYEEITGLDTLAIDILESFISVSLSPALKNHLAWHSQKKAYFQQHFKT